MQSDAAARQPEPAAPDDSVPVKPKIVLDLSHSAFDPFRETLTFPAMGMETDEPVPLSRPDVPPVELKRVATGEAALFSLKSPAKETPNEDALGVISFDSAGSKTRDGLLVVADGLGGHRGGRNASQMVVKNLTRGLKDLSGSQSRNSFTISDTIRIPLSQPPSGLSAQSVILEQIDLANKRLLKKGSGAATTIAAVEIKGQRARSYHVGDSEVLIVSQRGRIKHETVSHSPVSYALQAGLITEAEALQHEERHIVSNVVGSSDMSIELGPWVKLAPRDTILIASDGLFDNLTQTEIVDIIRVGRLEDSVMQLVNLALDRMLSPGNGHPSKCDDLTIVAYRRTIPKRNS